MCLSMHEAYKLILSGYIGGSCVVVVSCQRFVRLKLFLDSWVLWKSSLQIYGSRDPPLLLGGWAQAVGLEVSLP